MQKRGIRRIHGLCWIASPDTVPNNRQRARMNMFTLMLSPFPISEMHPMFRHHGHSRSLSSPFPSSPPSSSKIITHTISHLPTPSRRSLSPTSTTLDAVILQNLECILLTRSGNRSSHGLMDLPGPRYGTVPPGSRVLHRRRIFSSIDVAQ